MRIASDTKRISTPAALTALCLSGLVVACGGPSGPAASAASASQDGTGGAEGASGTSDAGLASAAEPAPRYDSPTPATVTAIGSGTSYDKEATEIALRRASLQVKKNCGQAKNADGKAEGPWGTTQVTVLLGHNGHVKSATVPAPFDGQNTGRCAIQAFAVLSFPPWDGADTSINWDVEIVQPTK